jgi:hypothetical protein
MTVLVESLLRLFFRPHQWSVVCFAVAMLPGGPALAQAPDAARTETVTGRIAHWLPNPNGDVDGLLLEDGTQVSFAPTLFAGVRENAQLHDEVQVRGSRGAALAALRALEIRNVRSGRSIGSEPRAEPRQPPPGREPSAITAMNATGRISALLHTGRGDLNGVMLDDGLVVRFPPHAVSSLASAPRLGGSFYARGYGTRGSFGNAFEATRLGSSEDSAQDIFAPPGGPAPRPPPPPVGNGPPR